MFQAERAKHPHRQAPDVRQPSQHRPVARLQGRHRQSRQHPGQHHRRAPVLQVSPTSKNSSVDGADVAGDGLLLGFFCLPPYAAV